MCLVILEVLSNPLLWGWGHSGDLTADFAPSSGEFDTMIFQIPCIPPPRGGHEIDKCITHFCNHTAVQPQCEVFNHNNYTTKY